MVNSTPPLVIHPVPRHEKHANHDPYHKTIRDPRRRVKHYERTGGKCWYCGDDLPDPWGMCLDHILSRSMGGTNDDNNLVPCCSRCNSRKHSKSIEQFREAERLRAVQFSVEQEEYLSSLGVTLPPLDERRPHIFAFEEHNWK